MIDRYCYFFFFKQKTAYEMRISDWSSDVCSSDLGQFFGVLLEQAGETDHRRFALARRQTRPDAGIEGRAGVFDGALGVGDIAAGNLAQHTAVHRAEAVKGFAGHRIGVLAIDRKSTRPNSSH